MARNGAIRCGAGDCAVNQYGGVECASTVGGGAAVNKYGGVECGPGACTVNPTYGGVECSSVASGGAVPNQYGGVTCQGGCVSGSNSLCRNGQ